MSKLENAKFARVDSDSIDNLIQKEEREKPQLSENEKKELGYVFESVLPSGAHYNVQIENLGVTAAPIVITQSEFMRRYKEMQALGGGLNFYGEMPDSYNVVLNFENPLIKKIIESKDAQTKSVADEINAKITAVQASVAAIDERNKEKKYDEIPTADKDEKERLNKEADELNSQCKDVMVKFAGNNTLVKQLTDLALLSNNMLKGKDLSEFVKRSLEILK